MSARRALLLLVAGTATVAVLAGASAPPSPAPSAPSTSSSTTRDTTAIWGVRPATADGKPDSRTHFTLQGAPGSTITDTALVSNLSTAPLTLSVYGTDAFDTNTGQFDLLAHDRKPTDIGSWMTFGSSTIGVPANGSIAVPFTITIPAAATPGDHAGGVVVSLVTLGAGQSVHLDTRVAVRVYLRIPGNLRPRLAIGPVTAQYTGGQGPMSNGSVTVTYTVTNPGNIRLRAKQSINVAGPFGIGLASLSPADLPELLPGQTATFTQTVSGVFPAGPITATVNLSPYPDAEQPVGQTIAPISGDATVYAWPWLLIGIVVILLVLGVVFWLWRRRRSLSRLDAAMLAAHDKALEEVGGGQR
jgi:hypothetical protein